MRLSLSKSEQNRAENERKPEKPNKNPKKPVESGLLLLTKFFESRKVNGGGVFRTRINTGSSWLLREEWMRKKEIVIGEPEEAAKQLPGCCNQKSGGNTWQQHLPRQHSSG
jgi:hypothetical protein